MMITEKDVEEAERILRELYADSEQAKLLKADLVASRSRVKELEDLLEKARRK